MKRIYSAMAIYLFFGTCSARASLPQLLGTWENTDRDTRGVTKLQIGPNQMRAWGQCHPTDCDWGTTASYAYASAVGDNLAARARAVTAVFVKNFSVTTVVVKPRGNGVRAEVYTRFTDSSGRTNYHQVYDFKRP